MVRPCGCADHRQQGWLMQNNRGSSKAKTQIRTFVGSPTDGPATCIPRRPGMIPRTLFSAEHEAFRTQVRRFMTEEVTPNRERWEAQQHVDRSIWTQIGRASCRERGEGSVGAGPLDCGPGSGRMSTGTLVRVA